MNSSSPRPSPETGRQPKDNIMGRRHDLQLYVELKPTL
jgi:hypothetical protein